MRRDANAQRSLYRFAPGVVCHVAWLYAVVCRVPCVLPHGITLLPCLLTITVRVPIITIRAPKMEIALRLQTVSSLHFAKRCSAIASCPVVHKRHTVESLEVRSDSCTHMRYFEYSHAVL